MKIRFLSTNNAKIAEVKAILSPEIDVLPHTKKIEELQTENEEKLIIDKLTKAFSSVGRPIFVEHTGLYIKELNDLPGGLTQIFWDKLQADKFCKIVSSFADKTIIAKTIIGYCDGAQIKTFRGEISGTVSNTPMGDRSFQWDCVFIPDGFTQTFAELGTIKKNEISMRAKALSEFKKFLLKK